MAVAAVLVAGCGNVLPPETGSPSPSTSATASPIARPTPTPVPAPTPAWLPVAAAEAADGVVTGSLGSYALDGSGSDAPWLPFDSLPALSVEPDQALPIRLADGSAIGGWSAQIAAAGDRTGSAVRGLGGRDDGAPLATVRVGPLPPGRWVLAARLFRADGRGNGLTFWAVTVP